MEEALKNFIILIIMAMILTGCKNIDDSKNDVINKTEENSSAKISSENLQDPIDEIEKNQSDTDEYNWDIADLRLSLGINDEMEVLFEYYYDFNNDNNKELIIAFGHDNNDEMDYIKDIYYLRKELGEYHELSHLANGGYSYFSVEIINLIDEENPVLYCKSTNYHKMIGFSIFEINDNTLKQLGGSTSATGAGYDEMIDSDGDGTYDGYTQYRNDYHTFNTKLFKSYDYIDGEFQLTSISADLNDYPSEPKEVVLEYLNLHMRQEIESVNILEIEDRLNELCYENRRFKVYLDYDTMFNNYISTGTLVEITTVEYSDENLVDVKMILDDDRGEFEVYYRLFYSNERWEIFDCRLITDTDVALNKAIDEYVKLSSEKLIEENSALIEMYKDVLLSKSPIKYDYVVAEGNQSYYVNRIIHDGYWMKLIRFSFVDMDGDSSPELVIEGSLGSAGFVQIIESVEGEMIAYEYSHRQMSNIKKDVSFHASSGSGHHGYYKLASNSINYDRYRVVVMEDETASDGSYKHYFYIGDDVVEEDAFWEYWEKVDQSDEVDWVYFEVTSSEED